MEIINPSKHSTCVILFLFKTFFINLASFSLNTSQICKTLPGKFFCSLQMVSNKGKGPHAHLTVICSIFFPAIDFIFLLGLRGIPTEGGWRSERQDIEKLYLLDANKENGFYFLFISLHSPCQHHHPEHVLVSLPTPVLFSTRLCFVGVSSLQ